MKNPLVNLAAAAILFTAGLTAQQPTPLPANYVHVSAPNAQKIALATFAKHTNEIGKIGIHATPKGEANAIIASDTPAKIGKKSSDKDLQKLAAGKPTSEPIDKDHIYDLFLPLNDAKGRSIGEGFIVMEVPYSKANNAEEALKIGTAIRDEVQKQIRSEAYLYQ